MLDDDAPIEKFRLDHPWFADRRFLALICFVTIAAAVGVPVAGVANVPVRMALIFTAIAAVAYACVILIFTAPLDPRRASKTFGHWRKREGTGSDGTYGDGVNTGLGG